RRVLEQRDWAYDGLARLVSESMPHDDPTGGYVPAIVRRLDYASFPDNVIYEQHALDWNACDANGCSGPATFKIKTLDGLDRIVTLQSFTGNGYENHSY